MDRGELFTIDMVVTYVAGKARQVDVVLQHHEIADLKLC